MSTTLAYPPSATPRTSGRVPSRSRPAARSSHAVRRRCPLETAPPLPLRRPTSCASSGGGGVPEDTEKQPASPTDTQAPTSTSAVPGGPGSSGGVIAGLAVAVGVAVFAATRLVSGAPTLADLQTGAIPLSLALSNHKPTIIEFYANWCETCREMTSDTFKLEQEFGSDVNFVMLNIDNTKWAEEMSQYKVNGIPEFVFLDGEGSTKALAVGKVPLTVLEQDAEALAQGKELPYAAVRREASPVQQPNGPSRPSAPSPRDHA